MSGVDMSSSSNDDDLRSLSVPSIDDLADDADYDDRQYEAPFVHQSDQSKTILTDDYSNTTMSTAIKLVDREQTSDTAWRSKELGLNLVLLGLAEVQALRLSQLSGLVYQLEQRVFSDETLRELDARKLIDVYRLGVESMNDAAAYVKGAVKAADWEKIELDLMTMAKSESTDTARQGESTAEIASALLAEMAKLKN